MSALYETEVGLAQAIFGKAELGDRRRTTRLVQAFGRMCMHPGGTLPQKFGSPADLRAFYRLCGYEYVTHEQIISLARQHTLTRIAVHDGPVLMVHDATELDYTSLTSLAGDLGQIGGSSGGCARRGQG